MKNIDKTDRNKEEKIKLAREALSYLLLIRDIKDQCGFRALIDNRTFKNEVIEKAEECGSEVVKEIASKLIKLEHSKLHIFLDSDECEQKIIQPLRNFLKKNGRWGKRDEKEIQVIADKLRNHIQMADPRKEWKRAKLLLSAASTFSRKAKNFVSGLKHLLEKLNKIKKAEG